MIRFFGCEHCNEATYPEPDLLGKLDFCHSCESTNMNRWLCLTINCNYIGCGQRSNDHSQKHYQSSNHPIAINLYNHKVYCNTCQKQIFVVNTEENEKSKLTNGYVKQEVTYVNPEQIDAGYEERPLGLVGLKNLGNTCYMNAALQCLLNVPQLTEFFESLSLSYFDDKSRILSRQYHNLIFDVFDYKNKPYVIPTGVSHTIKAIYPPFRGYLQQDAQEFLRVFIDKLHNETKYAVKIFPNEQASSTSNYGDCQNNNNMNSRSTNAPIKTWHSIINDIFQGRMTNSIKCLQCERISCNDDFYEDLSLPIANSSSSNNKWWPLHPKQIDRTKSSNPKSKKISDKSDHSKIALNLLYFQFCWVISFLVSFKNWFVSRSVTLEQCLQLFFSKDELKGDNKYSCDKCKGHQNAVMESKLISSPEILCLHLKRFKNDFGCSKITTSVTFPTDGLDMSPYLHPNHKNQVSLYDLIGVICHLGYGSSSMLNSVNAGGGHYIAYTLNWRSQTWYEFDDETVTEVDVNHVLSLTSSAYVLFYKKRDDHMMNIRETADKLLKTTASESLFKYHLSRSWVVKFNTFAEPGPINNYEFICPHGAVQPEKVVNINDNTIELSQKTWAYLTKQFGGGPTCTSLLVCPECERKALILMERRQYENGNFSQLHKKFENTRVKKDVHVLSLKWFRKWEDFVKGVEDDPPEPIDNSDILLTCDKSIDGYQINTNSDYGWISEETWQFLINIYGGGPAHNVCPSVEDKEKEELLSESTSCQINESGDFQNDNL